MDDTGKVNLIQELINDWQSGKISDVAALYAVCIIVRGNQPPSQNDIEWAERVYPELVAAMSLPTTIVIGLADKHRNEDAKKEA